MDFFENQHKAKRNSTVLYAMFVLVMLAFILSVMLVVGLYKGEGSIANRLTHPWSVSAGIIAILVYLTGSFIEWRRLSGGGKAIAKRIQAKPLYRFKSQDALNKHVKTTEPTFTPAEKRLLNVVENMSIASGVGKPHVFVLPKETSINAFVAGYKANDMVLVVTQGALEHLTEEELYGLVGHEFSHIAHGDTHINLKLMVLLGGLQLFYEIGDSLLYTDKDDDSHSYSYDYDANDDSYLLSDARSMGQGAVAALFMIGLLVILLSVIGIAFARLFKYALLRQREYLADAASVQYTRSHAVLQVLEKVRKLPEHGGISHVSSESISHFFFANAIPEQQFFSGVLSTHPPLDKRIKSISQSRYRLLKTQDEIKARQEAKLAKQDGLTPTEREKQKQQQAKESLRKKYQFEYREETDYDGTPVEFIPTQQSQSAKSPTVIPQTATSPAEMKNIPALSKQRPEVTIGQHNAMLVDPMIDTLKTPRGCLEMIAAALACHQQTNISPLDYEVSADLYSIVLDQPRHQDVSIIRNALDTLAIQAFQIDSKAALLYLHRLQHITHIDAKQTLLEALILERVGFQLGLQPHLAEDIQITEVQLASAFRVLANALLVNDNHTPPQRQLILSRMQKLVDIEDDAFTTVLPEKLTLNQCLNRLSTQEKTRKLNMLSTLETTLLADGKITQDETDILHLLQWRLQVDNSKVAA